MQRGGIRVWRLLAAAGVNRETWRLAKRNPAQTRRSTLARLDQALDELLGGAVRAAPGPAILMLYRVVFASLAQALGYDPLALAGAGANFSNEQPKAYGRLRRLAMYAVTVELEIPNADLARALGCTRQNVKQARNAVEEWRDDPQINDKIAAAVRVARGG